MSTKPSFMVKYGEKLEATCPELQNLPAGWEFDIKSSDKHEKRITFVKPSQGITTYNHPTLGCLPEPWILKLVKRDTLAVEYYNRKTKATTLVNPRLSSKNLASSSKKAPKILQSAASMRRVTTSDRDNISNFRHSPIETINLRNHYEVVHAIDPGDGTKGAMNGGVFVVRMKGVPGRLFIEKRFKPTDIEYAKSEIKMLHRLYRGALTAFNAAFITPGLNAEASLYIEFCDRGSLDDLCNAYSKRPHEQVPEEFAWHAFIGLCGGLAFLQAGHSAATENPTASLKVRNLVKVVLTRLQVDRDWIPILHRDIKPDNILLKSRHTIQTYKYPYTVMSDFGLAVEDRDNRDPRADYCQRTGSKLGTCIYWAPELCYSPYPREMNGPSPQREFKIFPDGYRHSTRSDVWALGACIYNLCVSDSQGIFTHLSLDRKPQMVSVATYAEGTASRKNPLTLSPGFSAHLREAVLIATIWDPAQRPDAIQMQKELRRLFKASGFDQLGKPEPIPSWATRVHEYQGKAEEMFSKRQSS